jgi:hypothetical protein
MIPATFWALLLHRHAHQVRWRTRRQDFGVWRRLCAGSRPSRASGKGGSKAQLFEISRAERRCGRYCEPSHSELPFGGGGSAGSVGQLDQVGSAGLYGQKKIWNPMPGTAFIWVSRCAAPLRRIAQGESGPTQPLTIALAGFKPALCGGLIFSSTQGPA